MYIAYKKSKLRIDSIPSRAISLSLSLEKRVDKSAGMQIEIDNEFLPVQLTIGRVSAGDEAGRSGTKVPSSRREEGTRRANDVRLITICVPPLLLSPAFLPAIN